jgi:hypothetical protein
LHIFEGHLRQEPPFDPEIITFGDDVPSALWGNTFAFRSKRSAPFFCALIAIRRRSQKRNAFEGNGTAADINSKERERESYIAPLLLERDSIAAFRAHAKDSLHSALFLLARVYLRRRSEKCKPSSKKNATRAHLSRQSPPRPPPPRSRSLTGPPSSFFFFFFFQRCNSTTEERETLFFYKWGRRHKTQLE